MQVTGVFTNTLPTDAYRGAGRPEACYVLERLADRAARELGIDRAEIRRRNLIPVSAMPYKTPIGPTYDCGDFPKIFARALEIAEYAHFPKRRAQAKRNGRLRGIGMALYVESSGVAPSRFAGALGRAPAFSRRRRSGCSRTAAFRRCSARTITARAMPPRWRRSSARGSAFRSPRSKSSKAIPTSVPYGTGTFGSRSIAVGGSALDRAAGKIVAKGKLIAAHLLETVRSETSISPTAGSPSPVPTGASRFADIAHAANIPHNFPLETLEPGLQETAVYDPPAFASQRRACSAKSRSIRDTGEIRVVAYWGVDDVGTVINPMIVEGQIHGGVAQGLGQALREHCVYDAASGQLLSGLVHGLRAAARRRSAAHRIRVRREPAVHAQSAGGKRRGRSRRDRRPAAIVSAVLDALAPWASPTSTCR